MHKKTIVTSALSPFLIRVAQLAKNLGLAYIVMNVYCRFENMIQSIIEKQVQRKIQLFSDFVCLRLSKILTQTEFWFSAQTSELKPLKINVWHFSCIL